MLQIPSDSSIRKEVSESIFEYLLGEIIFPHPDSSTDSRTVVEAQGSGNDVTSTGTNSTTAVEHRLESLGYDVGYRYQLHSSAVYLEKIK